jgi:hypothetical protein
MYSLVFQRVLKNCASNIFLYSTHVGMLIEVHNSPMASNISPIWQPWVTYDKKETTEGVQGESIISRNKKKKNHYIRLEVLVCINI